MKFCFLILSSTLLLSCDIWNAPYPRGPQGPPITNTPTNPSPNTTPTTTATTEWGVVKCYKTDQSYNQFNHAVKLFLSSTINPATNVNAVNCAGLEGLKGGMWIRGKVQFEDDAVFSPQNPSQNLLVSESSYLEIHIVDLRNKAILGIKMQAIPYAGGVEGNSITLAFSDSKGKVSLNGSIEEGLFTGVFEFENFTDWRGARTGAKGQIGIFSIHPCSLFKCASSTPQ